MGNFHSFKLILNGMGPATNFNLFRVEIPTEWLNTFLYGCCFPVHPLSLLGLREMFLGPLRLTQSTLEEAQFPSASIQEISSDEKGKIPLEGCCTPCEWEDSTGDFSETEEHEVDLGDGCDFDEDECYLRNARQGVSRINRLKSLEVLELENTRVGQEKKKRGRKPKSIAGPQILREVTEGAGGVDPEIARLQEAAESSGAGGYFTRATKAWLLGKSIGFSFPGSDEEAIRGLVEEIQEDSLSTCQ